METYQYDLVKKLSFVRYGGTEMEAQAANILMEEIKNSGGNAIIEEFKIPACKTNKCTVKVTKPYEKELEVMPFYMCGNSLKYGADLKLLYLEDCSDLALYGKKDLSNTVVLVNGLLLEHYKTLCEKKAAAILVIYGKWFYSSDNSDFLPRSLRTSHLTFGKIPTFYIWAKDALGLIKNEAETINIELEQDEFENTSRNVVATINGTEILDEAIVISAHYDSVSIGTGSWDNATGAATAMYVYKHFLKSPPKRTMHFVWCGSEEQGLYGSKAYIEAHPHLIENNIKFGFNFDMCGIVLGTNLVYATGKEKLANFAEAFCKEYGLNAKVYQEVRSSDSANFADKGIPTIDIARRGNTADIHTRYDLLDILSAKQLKKDGDFSVAFIERVVNSAILPVETGMPDNVKEKLDDYFRKAEKLKEQDTK